MAHRGFRGTLLAVVVGSALAGEAGAAGFALIEQNAGGLGNAYAGQAAAAEDASTIWFKPAGMIRLPGRQTVGALTAVKPSSKFSIDGNQPCTQTSATSAGALPPLISTGCTNSGGDAGDWGFPISAYLSWQLTPEFWVGVGLGAPFSLTEWDSGWVGRFHAIKSEVMTVNINPSVAWKINEMFSVGAGVNAMYIDAELSNSVDYSAIRLGVGGPAALGALAAPGACPGANSGAVTGGPRRRGNCEGVANTVKADDWSWGWNLGAVDQLLAEYARRPHVPLGGEAEAERRREFLEPPGIAQQRVAEQRRQRHGEAARLVLGRGRALHGPLAVPRRRLLDRLAIDADLSIYDGAASCCLTSTALKFKNGWRAGLGVNYQLNSEWKLRGGVAYDTTPVQDAFRTPRLPRPGPHLALDRCAVAGQQDPARDRLRLRVPLYQDASSNLPSLETNQPSGFTPTPKGNLVGTYNANVNILGIQGRFNFLTPALPRGNGRPRAAVLVCGAHSLRVDTTPSSSPSLRLPSRP